MDPSGFCEKHPYIYLHRHCQGNMTNICKVSIEAGQKYVFVRYAIRLVRSHQGVFTGLLRTEITHSL